MATTLLWVAIASLLGGVGHVILAKGMKVVGAAAIGSPLGRTLSNPWVLLGVALQAAFFFIYMALLSREDVSKGLPLTTLNYIIVALLAALTLADVLPLAREYELAVLHTSAPSFAHDVKVAEALKGENPALRIGLIGAHVAVRREAALAASPALDFVCGNEFDFTIREIAEGRPPASVAGLSYRDIGGELRRTPERPVLEDMDSLPWVVDVYARDLA